MESKRLAVRMDTRRKVLLNSEQAVASGEAANKLAEIVADSVLEETAKRRQEYAVCMEWPKKGDECTMWLQEAIYRLDQQAEAAKKFKAAAKKGRRR